MILVFLTKQRPATPSFFVDVNTQKSVKNPADALVQQIYVAYKKYTTLKYE